MWRGELWRSWEDHHPALAPNDDESDRLVPPDELPEHDARGSSAICNDLLISSLSVSAVGAFLGGHPTGRRARDRSISCSMWPKAGHGPTARLAGAKASKRVG